MGITGVSPNITLSPFHPFPIYFGIWICVRINPLDCVNFSIYVSMCIYLYILFWFDCLCMCLCVCICILYLSIYFVYIFLYLFRILSITWCITLFCYFLLFSFPPPMSSPPEVVIWLENHFSFRDDCILFINKVFK